MGNGCARRLYGVTILLKCGSYTSKYGGNLLCACLCINFSNLRFLIEVQYVQYNGCAL